MFAGYAATSSNLQAGCIVASYSIGSNGQLTLADQERITSNCDTIAGMTVDPSGKNLYVSGNYIMFGGMISTFTIDRTTGKLINSSPDVGITQTAMPGKIAIHPSGLYAYVSRMTPHHYPGMGGWSFYVRDPVTGTLTDTGKVFNQPTWPNEYIDATFVLGGKYLFSVAFGEYAAYSVDQLTGNLTFVGKWNGNFWGIVADQSGNYVIINQRDGPVQSYRVNADGTLTPVGGGNTDAADNNNQFFLGTTIVFDRTGRYVYAESPASAQIFAFTFSASTGALVAVPGSPFAAKSQPVNIATAGH